MVFIGRKQETGTPDGAENSLLANGMVQVYKEWYGTGLEGMVWYRFRRNGMVQV